MFLTIAQNQLPTLAGAGLRAWPAVELEFDEPVLLCSWAEEETLDAVRGTALVLLEHDLRHWLERTSPGPTLRCLQMLEPTEFGWRARDIQCVREEQGNDAKGRRLVLEDAHGCLVCLWGDEDIAGSLATPIWRPRAVFHKPPLLEVPDRSKLRLRGKRASPKVE